MDVPTSDDSTKPVRTGESAPLRKIEQEEKRNENQFVTNRELNASLDAFGERFLMMLQTTNIAKVSAALAPSLPISSHENVKRVQLQEPLGTPDPLEPSTYRPRGSDKFYIAPTIEFDRQNRKYDRCMEYMERPRDTNRTFRLEPMEEDEYEAYSRRQRYNDHAYFDSDEEYHNFRRAQEDKDRKSYSPVPPGTVRRESIITRAIKSVDATVNAVQVIRSQASFDNIMLTKLDVKHFASWSEKIVEYTNINKISLHVTSLVSAEIRQLLISYDRSLNQANWSRLTAQEVFSLCLDRLRPKSVIDFCNKLKENVRFEFHRKSVPTSGNFEPLYEALLVYRTKFILIYEILAEKNEHNIPPVTNKDGGLIKIFIDKIDTGSYAQNVVKGFGSNRFSDIHEFLESFFKVVEKHSNLSVGSKEVDDHLGGSSYFAQAAAQSNDEQKKKQFSYHSSAARSSTPVSRKDSTSTTSNYKPSSSHTPSYSKWSSSSVATPSRSTHHVSHMENVEDASDAEREIEQRVLIDSIMSAAASKSNTIEDDDAVRHDEDEQDHEPYNPREKASIEDHDADFEAQLQAANDLNELAMIQAVSSHSRTGINRSSGSSSKSSYGSTTTRSSADTFPNGCYTMVLHGSCKNSSCRFSHNQDVLERTWTHCAKLLAASKFKPKISSMSHMILMDTNAYLPDDQEQLFDVKLAELHHNMLLAVASCKRSKRTCDDSSCFISFSYWH